MLSGPAVPRRAETAPRCIAQQRVVLCVWGVPSELVALRPRRGVSIGGAGVHSLLPGSYLQRQARLARGPHAHVCTELQRQAEARACTYAHRHYTRTHIRSVVLTQTHACLTRTRTRAPFDGVEVGAAVGAADRKKMAALHGASRQMWRAPGPSRCKSGRGEPSGTSGTTCFPAPHLSSEFRSLPIAASIVTARNVSV